jgi:hypothetical protein
VVVEHRDVPAAGQGDPAGLVGQLVAAAGDPGQQYPVPGAERDGDRHGDRGPVLELPLLQGAQGLPEAGRNGHVVDRGPDRLVGQVERVSPTPG